MAKTAKRQTAQTPRVEAAKRLQAQTRKDLQRNLREVRRIAAMAKQFERAVRKSHVSLRELRDFLIVWLIDADELAKTRTPNPAGSSRGVLAAEDADRIFGTGTEG